MEKQKAFTLVELIVVIVIMAILATIAFLSYSSYSSQTRDSARLSDMSNLSESLEFYRAKVGSYPTPPNAVFNVTYSGAMVWYQGTIGDDFVRKLGASAGISKKPVDPLSGKEYIYSNVANGSAYQLKSDLEADTIALKKDEDIFIQTASASAGNPKISYIRGNYGGVIAKAQTGSIIYLLAVPSIISSTGSAGQTIEISSNSLSGYLLLNSQSNTTGIQYNPNKVVFTGTGIPSTDTNSGITNIMIALKNAYSGTTVQTINPTVSQMISTPDAQLVTIGAGVISSQIGGGIDTSGGNSGNNGTTVTNGSCGSANGSVVGSAPATNLCNNGTPSAVGGVGPWNWTCAGSNGGTSASCSAGSAAPGACGSANKSYAYNVSSYGGDTFCNVGSQTPASIAFPAQGSSVSWICNPNNGGAIANCTASRAAAPVNGACGSANGSSLTSAPTTNLCTSGSATAVTGAGPWNWSCTGSNSGTTANCSASKSSLYVDGAACTLNSQCSSNNCWAGSCRTVTCGNLSGSYYSHTGNCAYGTAVAVDTCGDMSADGGNWIECRGNENDVIIQCLYNPPGAGC